MLLDIFHFGFCQTQYFGICQTQPIVATLEDIMFTSIICYMYDVDSAKTLDAWSFTMASNRIYMMVFRFFVFFH